MRFNPCIPGQCTDQGSHCEGCGRTQEEIAETKKSIKALVALAQTMEYENYEDFAGFIAKSIVGKLRNPS